MGLQKEKNEDYIKRIKELMKKMDNVYPSNIYCTTTTTSTSPWLTITSPSYTGISYSGCGPTTSCSCSLDLTPSYKFIDIIEYVPEKVYEFKFHDGTSIKTICDEEDEFNLEFAFYLALAKKIYGKTFDLYWILNYEIEEMMHTKDFIKEVDKGMKLFKKLQKDKRKAKEEEERIKVKKKKLIAKKQARRKRKREE